MKPLRLQFKGINSFSDKTVIDFEKLTQNGIFGIFGDTGSGKSTILDCINFALYGDVDRSEEKTDIINYRCEVLEVSFTFEITDEGKRKTFIVERSLKKKSGTHKAVLYEICEKENKCIADNATSVKNKIISLLGLDAKDFRKCIALPQGEFAQFVKSQPAERIKLIERLFDLSKYGVRLKEKLSLKEKSVDERYNELNGKLSVYEDVSDESLAAALDKLKNCEQQLEILNKRFDCAVEEYDNISKLYEKKLELDESRLQLNALNDSKSEMDKLRNSLKSLEGARLIFDMSTQISEKSALIERVEREIQALCQSKLKCNSNLQSLLEQQQNADYDTKIAESIALSSKYMAFSDLPQKLENATNEVDILRKKYLNKDFEHNQALKIKSEFKNKVSELNLKLEKVNGISLDSFFKNFKDEILKEEYQKQLNVFADLRSDIQSFERDTALYKYLKERFDEQLEYYRQRIIALNSKGVKVFDLQSDLNALQASLDERELLLKQINETNSQLSHCESEIAVISAEKERITQDGKKASAEKAQLKEKLVSVFGENCIDYSGTIEAEKNKLDKLNAEKTAIINKIKAEEEAFTNIEIKISSLSSQKESLIAETEALIFSRKQQMEKFNFSSLDDCKGLVAEFNAFSDAESTLSQFDENYAHYSRLVSDLEKLDKINEVTAKEYNDAKINKEQADKELKSCSVNLAVLNNEYKDLSRRIEEKKGLLNLFNQVQKDKNLISQLKEILKNNKFLEFIANEYLCEISSLASATLLKLTSGRYFLTYKENFYVGDNYDRGNLRGVNTLSGGETFLVSLSLALALSSTICSKSQKSIEFFFLDEGFGTLDGTLIDTVMDALEKLKSENFTIGVISHVEELKHRIASKIIVNKATETHGSTVSVWC